MRRIRSVFPLSLTLVLMLGFAVGCSELTAPESPASEISEDAALTSGHRVVANFAVPLSGDEVVPPVDTDARGLATFQLNKEGTELRFKLNVANIEDVIGAHIHNAPAGQNGPIVVFLYGDPLAEAVTVNGTLVQGTATEVVGPLAGDFEALIDAMESGNTYVQVHTTANPSGEIRGQIVRGNGVK